VNVKVQNSFEQTGLPTRNHIPGSNGERNFGFGNREVE
jgi:hypothetical protein